MKSELDTSRIVGYSLAVAASISYGASLVLAKQVVEEVPPLVGASLGMIFGMLVLGVVSSRDIKRDIRAPRRAFVWAGLSGLAAGGGIAMMFLAMSNAPVVVVAPMIAVNPLTAILFGQIFIRNIERLTIRMLLGACLVVVGVIIISLGRNV
jgi:drug/metabolite transporter (DMT)-like permease